MANTDFAEQAACAKAVAEVNGLEVQSVSLIGGYANAMFRLEPWPLVARVAAGSNVVRQGNDWLCREIAVAEHLEKVGARSTRPSKLLSAGPHSMGQYHLSFWEYVPITPRLVTPTELGHELRELHASLAAYSADLPAVGALDEAWRILEDAKFAAKLLSHQADVVARRSGQIRDALARWPMECRPLHGDAHHGNLWPTIGGLVWGDFEDAHSGPVEWDIACMIASSRVFGHSRAGTVALEAYANSFDPELLDLLIVGRTLQAIAWALVALPEPTQSERFQKRVSWLT